MENSNSNSQNQGAINFDSDAALQAIGEKLKTLPDHYEFWTHYGTLTPKNP